ncbi:MAG: hypothetical protein LVQ97_04985 [Candidatus Micrarchaeales archaeon]|nr:hypothetical protein [Candidatus Micrarchaeales archaeon]
MKYARDGIKHYWVFAYRRALGASMVTFAVALAAGILFSSVLGSVFLINPVISFVFWLLLILITAFTIVISFVNAHSSTTKFMNSKELPIHKKYVGAWLAIIVIGILSFLLPLLFVSYSFEPLIFLFTFGGILWIMYISVAALFRYRYVELAFGAVALWAVFVVSALLLAGNSSSASIASSSYAEVTTITFTVMIILVFGIIGMMMLFNSTNDFIHEIEDMISLSMAPETKTKSQKLRRRK